MLTTTNILKNVCLNANIHEIAGKKIALDFIVPRALNKQKTTLNISLINYIKVRHTLRRFIVCCIKIGNKNLIFKAQNSEKNDSKVKVLLLKNSFL